jgi:S-adenosylmethionine synthetase
MREYLFTSESVTEGHPDKVCDKIADSIVDDILAHDREAHIACEVSANTGLILVFGEITTTHYCNVAQLARDTLVDIGYDACPGFSAHSCAVLTSIDEQSPDIAGGVFNSLEWRNGSRDELERTGAGDQGMMFGFASTDSEAVEPGTYMPLPIHLAHRLARDLAAARRSGTVDCLRPDGKTQVTVEYDGYTPKAVRTVLISTQHDERAEQAKLASALFEHVLAPAVPAALCPGGEHRNIEFLVNPSGRFVRGGPEADSGLTGRKIIVDTYGGMGRHGGGAFSGKDPSKVDRSAAYYGRYVAKNLVAAGAAQRLELQVSYAIGRARPTSLNVETFGTGRVDEDKLERLLTESGLFDFRPLAIIQKLRLLDTRFAPLAAYGHFGRTDVETPWEHLDAVDAVRQELGL